jgi:hypothetical protein
MEFHEVRPVARWLAPAIVISLGAAVASAHTAAPRAATAPPQLLALAYGRFQPPGAPQPHPALRLTAREPNGQIIDVAFQELRNGLANGVGGDFDGRCGIGGRRNGDVEISYLPLAQPLSRGTHHLRVVAYGSRCEKNRAVTSSARTFTVHVKG